MGVEGEWRGRGGGGGVCFNTELKGERWSIILLLLFFAYLIIIIICFL